MRRRVGVGLLILWGALVMGGCGGGVAPNGAMTPPVAPVDVPATPTMAVATEIDEAAPTAQVAIVFDRSRIAPGDRVAATVAVAGVEDLYGVQMRLTFDVAMLAVIDQDEATAGVQVADGDVLEVAYVVQNAVDHDAGTIDYAVSQMPPSTGVCGDGALLQVVFEAKAAGVTQVEVHDVVLAASGGDAIPVLLDPAVAEVQIE